MKTLKQLLSALPESQEGVRKVSEISGVPFNTLIKIARGYTGDPRESTVELLRKSYAEWRGLAKCSRRCARTQG
jgi:hypothetical protein